MFSKSHILYGGRGGGGGGGGGGSAANTEDSPALQSLGESTSFEDGSFQVFPDQRLFGGKGLRTTSTQAGDRVFIYVPYNFSLTSIVQKSAVLEIDDIYLTDESNVRKTLVKNEKLLGHQVNKSGDKMSADDFYKKEYTILDTNLRNIYVTLRIVSLSETNKGTGDILDSSVKVSVGVKPLFSNAQANDKQNFTSRDITFFGRLSSPYLKEFKIHLGSSKHLGDPDLIGWRVKVYKMSAEKLSTLDYNMVYVNDITCETDHSLNYPNCALVRQVFEAEYFSEIPSRAFDCKLLKIKVPNIYDPLTRSYNVDPATGNKQFNTDGSPKVLVWDGTFKEEKVWTDNPAWCFYDLLTNPRYGTGKHIEKDFVDKWTLFEIGKFCDQLVPTGEGGTVDSSVVTSNLEPRFSCNVIINSREDAYKLLNDMSSVFRGLVYYYNNSIIAVQDSLKDSIYSFNRANVTDGNFSYSSSSRKVRRTVAVVRYNDKTDFHKPAIEYAEDVDGIRRHGYREIDITAFACTSRTQAKRLGKWILFTENLETETVSFNTGLEGSLIRPGDVVTIVDSNRGGMRSGGRLNELKIEEDVLVGNQRKHKWTFLLDGELVLHKEKKYKLLINCPNFNYDPSLGITDLKSEDASGVRNPHLLSFNISHSNLSLIDARTQITVAGENHGVGDETLKKKDLIRNPQNITWSIVSVNSIDPPSTWSADDAEHYVPEEKFRVLNVKSNPDLTYEIVCLEYRPEKYALIDN